jgi:hypothetical protein
MFLSPFHLAAHLKIVQLVRFEVFTAVTMKNAVFWDVAPCRSCVTRRFGGTYHLHLQGRKIRERGTSVSRWLQKTAFFIVKLLTMYQIICLRIEVLTAVIIEESCRLEYNAV